MHEHTKCEHKNLKYCEKCDVAYCPDCKKEWRYDFSTYTFTNPNGTGGTIYYDTFTKNELESV